MIFAEQNLTVPSSRFFLVRFLIWRLAVLKNQGRWRFLLEVALVRKVIALIFLLADEFFMMHAKIEDAVVWACWDLGRSCPAVGGG